MNCTSVDIWHRSSFRIIADYLNARIPDGMVAKTAHDTRRRREHGGRIEEHSNDAVRKKNSRRSSFEGLVWCVWHVKGITLAKVYYRSHW